MGNKVKEVQDYLKKKGLNATETSIVNAALEIACRRDLLFDHLFVRKDSIDQEDELKPNKAEEVQEYLRARGLVVSETSIINAAIDLARRWGGNAVFVGELTNEVDR